MKPIDVDARRYAWCRSHALWIINMSAITYLEDARGADQAGQEELLRYVARMIGDACVAALNLALNYDRPIPSPAMRASWALDRIQGHELWLPCWELIRGMDDASGSEVVACCEDLVERVSRIVGEMPNILTPEGHYPAIAQGREWIKLMEEVGEEAPLPYNWTLPT